MPDAFPPPTRAPTSGQKTDDQLQAGGGGTTVVNATEVTTTDVPASTIDLDVQRLMLIELRAIGALLAEQHGVDANIYRENAARDLGF